MKSILVLDYTDNDVYILHGQTIEDCEERIPSYKCVNWIEITKSKLERLCNELEKICKENE